MKILKFGGSSVRDAERIKDACSIALSVAQNGNVAVVFSAMKGITDNLISITAQAESGDERYQEILSSIIDRHNDVYKTLIPDEDEGIRIQLDSLFTDLSELAHGIYLVRECSPRSLDLVMSFGEQMNCALISGYLNSTGTAATYIDARDIITTDSRHGAATVDMKTTMKAAKGVLRKSHGIPIVTGFIASSKSGATTTLGRNGSDYTASVLGAALGADEIQIWTDVDGVMSADPRFVPDAYVVSEINTEEAMELSYFGAEVIHPSTMVPAVEADIPIRIKNTMNPDAPGTVIRRDATPHGNPITGIASIEDVALINVEGGGMIGVPGIAARVFSALAQAEVNVIMISQASSEHSICLVCREREIDRALEYLSGELAYEIDTRLIHRFDVRKDLEIIAVIGENMRGTPGMSGKLFSSLGDAGVNVVAIAQGSSERNISFLIANDERIQALNAVHGAFLTKKG